MSPSTNVQEEARSLDRENSPFETAERRYNPRGAGVMSAEGVRDSLRRWPLTGVVTSLSTGALIGSVALGLLRPEPKRRWPQITRQAEDLRHRAEDALDHAASSAKETLSDARSSVRRNVEPALQAGRRVYEDIKPLSPKLAPLAWAALGFGCARLMSSGFSASRPRRTNGSVPYERLTREELYERAQELNIPGRSSMTKDELVEALRAASGQ